MSPLRIERPWIRSTFSRGGFIQVNLECTQCRKNFIITVAEPLWQRWLQGEYIQVALACLPKEERELILSGTCGKCFEAIFAGCEDEED